MDDFVVWASAREELKAVRGQVTRFLGERLGLELKPEPTINRVSLGMDFLGYRLYGSTVRLSRRSARRFERKFRSYEGRYVAGEWTEGKLQSQVTALVAFTLPAQAPGLRRRFLERFGVTAEGFQPREPRGQLEQQRQELPVSEPQQQRPESRNNNIGFRVVLAPAQPWPRTRRRLTRPPSCPCPVARRRPRAGRV